MLREGPVSSLALMDMHNNEICRYLIFLESMVIAPAVHVLNKLSSLNA